MDPEPTSSPDADGPRPQPREPRRRRRGRLHESLHRHPISSAATKLVVTGIGAAVLLAGVIMLVTPGPGLLGIVVGLGILATEWAWADSLLDGAARKLREAQEAAARVDPKVRRRRIIWSAVAALVVLVAVVALVWTFGWPGFVVEWWKWLQSRAGWLPDLPGM